MANASSVGPISGVNAMRSTKAAAADAIATPYRTGAGLMRRRGSTSIPGPRRSAKRKRRPRAATDVARRVVCAAASPSMDTRRWLPFWALSISLQTARIASIVRLPSSLRASVVADTVFPARRRSIACWSSPSLRVARVFSSATLRDSPERIPRRFRTVANASGRPLTASSYGARYRSSPVSRNPRWLVSASMRLEKTWLTDSTASVIWEASVLARLYCCH